MAYFKYFAAITLLFLMTACGGGSGGGDDTPNNRAPTASNVSIVDDNGGNVEVGDNLTGSYTYADADGDTEGSSTFQWLRDTIAINGATTDTYTIVTADNNASITFIVTPVASTGTTTGTSVTSTGISVINRAPVSEAQSVSTPGGTPISITLTGSDLDGDSLSFSIADVPASGTLTGTAPNLTYTPNTGFTGIDSFSYTVSDSIATSLSATISVAVANTPPTGAAQSVSTHGGTPLSITLTGSDVNGDTLSYNVTSTPASGTLTGTAPNLTYTPNTGFTGDDNFSYTVSDGIATSSPATISVVVTNTAPTGAAQSVSTHADVSLSIVLTGTDADSDAITYSVASDPENGTLTGTAPDLTYVPAAGFVGNDSFTYTVSDIFSTSVASTISIAVTNTAPIASFQSVTTDRSTALSILLTGTDADPEDTSLSYTVASNPSKGELSGTAPNLTYTPYADALNTDSFTYTVSDGIATSAAATIEINVTNAVPNTFTFTDLPEVAPSSTVNSNSVTVEGINQPSTVTITGGEYSINGAAFTSTAGTVTVNQAIVVRVSASATAAETVSAVLNIGGVEDTFSVTTSSDVIAPTVAFTFPSNNSLASAGLVTVSGTTTDNGTIGGVTVNDVDATSLDNFVTWHAQVPLDDGANLLSAIATDLGGNTSAISTVTVEARQLFNSQNRIHFNNTSNKLIFADSSLRGVYDFDPATSLYSVLSDNTTPDSTNRMGSSRDIDVDETTDHLYYLNSSSLDKILDIDLATGTRTVVTEDTEAYAAHTLLEPHHIQVDEATNTAYILDATASGSGRRAILKFDLVTGAASVLTENSFTWSDSIALDKANNRILMADTFGSNRIHAFDLTTGAKSNLWNSSNTLSLGAPKGIAIDTINERALVYDNNANGIFAITLDAGIATTVVENITLSISTFTSMDMVYDGTNDNNRVLITAGNNTITQIDLTTGVESVFSSNTVPDTINPLSAVTGLTLDTANNRLLVTDSNLDAVLEVDLTDGTRTVISDPLTPDATNLLSFPRDVGILPNNQAYVIDSTNDSLTRIDLAGGARAILSDNTVIDADNTFHFLAGLALDLPNARSLVVDRGRQSLISIDNATGARAVISDNLTPDNNNPIDRPEAIILEGGRALITNDNNSILSVDLNSGARTVFSSSDIPDPNNRFSSPSNMVLDASNNRLLIIDTRGERVMAVSLADGSRTVLTSNTVPDGNHPFSRLSDITIDTANNRALAVDTNMDVTFAIDLTSGARTPYMGSVPSGSSAIYQPQSIVFDTASKKAFFYTGGDHPQGLYTGDPLTGLTNRVSTSSPIQDIAIDSTVNRMFMVSSGALSEVDMNTGATTPISNNTTPDSDNPFSRLRGVVLNITDDNNLTNDIAYVVDSNTDSVLSVNLSTGVRTVISSDNVPDDVNSLTNPVALVLDETRLLTLDETLDAVIAIDIATGARTILSNNGTPDTLELFSRPVDMIMDNVNGRALVLDAARRAIYGVDLTTGARTKLTNIAGSSVSNLLVTPRDLALTDIANQVMVTDITNGIILVNLVTGEQVIMSK